MAQPLLFNGETFQQRVDGKLATVYRVIALLTHQNFSEKTAGQISAELYDSHRLTGLVVDTAATFQTDPSEIQIDVVDESAPQGKRLTDGTRFDFYVPFTGDTYWLNILPTAPTQQLPFGERRQNNIYFSLEKPTTDYVEELVSSYQSNLQRIDSCVAALTSDINSFNTALQQDITTRVAARKARLDQMVADSQAFSNTPQT